MSRRFATTLAASALSLVVLAGCSTATAGPSSGTPSGTVAAGAASNTSSAAANGSVDVAKAGVEELKGADARTLVDKLEATPLSQRRTDLRASVRADELQLSDTSGNKASVKMPADQFYLSFAPYVNKTHDCTYHSLTTCKAELGNKQMHVTITDAAGATVIDQDLTAADNGFIGVWLPRNITGTLTVNYDGKSASQQISTAKADDPTCLTTLHLA